MLLPISSPSNNELLQDVLLQDVLKVKEYLAICITSVNIIEIEIVKSEEKVQELKNIIQAKGCSSTQSLKCDLSDYYCSSEQVVKVTQAKSTIEKH